MDEKVIEFDIPAAPMSMNDRDGSAKLRAEGFVRKEAWRDAAYYAACAASPGEGPSGRAMPPCDVWVSIPVAGERRRDPHNLYPTIKAIVDGITTAGVWPDDTPEWVATHEPALRVVAKGELMKSKVIVRLVPR